MFDSICIGQHQRMMDHGVAGLGKSAGHAKALGVKESKKHRSRFAWRQAVISKIAHASAGKSHQHRAAGRRCHR